MRLITGILKKGSNTEFVSFSRKNFKTKAKKTILDLFKRSKKAIKKFFSIIRLKVAIMLKRAEEGMLRATERLQAWLITKLTVEDSEEDYDERLQ